MIAVAGGGRWRAGIVLVDGLWGVDRVRGGGGIGSMVVMGCRCRGKGLVLRCEANTGGRGRPGGRDR